MSTKLLVPVIGILASLNFLSCSSGSKPQEHREKAAAVGPIDVCSFVTRADATALFGSGPVEPGAEIGTGIPGRIGRCEWQLPGKRGPAVQILVVEVYRDVSFYAGDYKRDKQGVRFLELGDRGYLEIPNDSTLQAQFVAGAKTILITYTFASEAGLKPAAKTDSFLQLARKIASAKPLAQA